MLLEQSKIYAHTHILDDWVHVEKAELSCLRKVTCGTIHVFLAPLPSTLLTAVMQL